MTDWLGRWFAPLMLVALGASCGRTDVSFATAGLPGDGGGDGRDDGENSGDGGTDPTGIPGTPGDLPPGGECSVAAQCPAADSCTTVRCVQGYCAYFARDDDGDGYPPFECGGEDCNDLNPNTFPGLPENCFDGDDNDCNGVADCFDPACEGVPDCGCIPADSETCTNGRDDDCDTTVDCNDPDCIGTQACGCAANEAGLCVNGFDDDCDGLLDCDDSDCVDDPQCLCMEAVEQCQGGFDEDCDLLIDCADPDCEGTFACTCSGPPTPEDCADGVDNDCDELVDCADPDCIVSAACQECSPELCTDGVDNNCDDRIDCADPACAFDPTCAAIAEQCNNDLDDDNDGLVDCNDPDCENAPICAQTQSNCGTAALIGGSGTYTGDTTGNVNNTEGSCGGRSGEAVFYFVLNEASRVILDSIGTSFDSVLYVRSGSCLSGQEVGCDDDSAGSMWAARLDFTLLYPGTYFVFLDGFTVDPKRGSDEGPWQLNVEIIPNPPEICDDGIDNDGDVYADCGDPDCALVPPCAGCNEGDTPQAEFGPELCSDGRDNDCDGVADCDDTDCSASDYYITECCNGTDQNGNGIPDDFNCRCANDSECDDGQICYDHTAYACGFTCDSFFGDVCPFVAPGSSCNLSTGQCEF